MPQAEVAHVQDYDSDQSETKPGTRVNAHYNASHGRQSKKTGQRPGLPYAASDSGYSSYTNNAVASNTVAQQQSVTAAQAMSQRTQTTVSARKPAIHQVDGQRVQQGAPSRSVSVSKPCASGCDGDCVGSKNTELRHILPRQQQQRPQPQPNLSYTTQQFPVQNPATPMSYQQSPVYAYAQPNATQAVPTSNAQPTSRSRVPSVSQARPCSWYGGMNGSTAPQTVYSMATHGPPQSLSPYAYGQQYATQNPTYFPTMAAPQLGSTPPTNLMASYMPPLLANMAPPSPQRPVMPPHTFSARQGNPTASVYDTIAMPTSQPQSSPAQTISARRNSLMPGTFPAHSAARNNELDSESESRSASGSEESEYEERLRYDNDTRKRDSRLMPPPPVRRPSLKKTKTTPAVSTWSSREPPRRSGRANSDLDRPLSSGHIDSDRTTRPVINQRSGYNSMNSSRSRRPSVSTNSSSDRTKTTTNSSTSGSGTGRYIVEDSRGRRSIYPSLEEAERIARHLARTTLEDEVEAYQTRVRGAEPPDLTLENIKRSQQPRQTNSRVSGSSRKSGTSSKASKSEHGVHIRSGDTVLQILGDAKIEMRQGEDGEHSFLIAASSGRESTYGGSNGSGSRVGRSRTGSRRRRDTIHEEDGYEPAM